jgi:hypothetical protein
VVCISLGRIEVSNNLNYYNTSNIVVILLIFPDTSLNLIFIVFNVLIYTVLFVLVALVMLSLLKIPVIEVLFVE